LLEDLQKNYDELEKRGIVPLSEVVRIRSLLYGLRSDKLDLQNQFNDKQALLQLLLQDNTIIYIPEIDKSEFVFENPSEFLLPYLVNEAKENRIDLKTLQSEITYHNKNYSLQKAMAVPDITIGAEYDKRGSFADHIPLLTMSIDLPLFNRNQGNIKAAKASIKQSEIQFQQKQLEVENEVHKAYLNALNADKINNSIAPGFESDLQNILQNITENFKKRNISMLEFTDFYESYRDNVIHLNQIKNQKAQAMEELRFVVGTNITQ
jgi:cobalt-zinc-cadmium efflux system outer membrane protein